MLGFAVYCLPVGRRYKKPVEKKAKKLACPQVKRKKFNRSGTFFVYIVQCRDKTYYTGYTPAIEKRIQLHNAGRGAKYTRDRRPVKLVWCKEYRYFKKAFLEEKRIKLLTRPQKEKLIDGKR